MTRKKGKGYFSISAVAKMFSVHQQTIRMYEKEGLISPKRSEGNTRLFSEEDLERLEEVIHLTHTLGINLAGVEMILKQRKQMKKMQKDMNRLFKQANQELDEEVHLAKSLIKKSSQELLLLKSGNSEKPSVPSLSDNAKKNNQRSEAFIIEGEDYDIDGTKPDDSE